MIFFLMSQKRTDKHVLWRSFEKLGSSSVSPQGEVPDMLVPWGGSGGTSRACVRAGRFYSPREHC